MFIGVEHAVSAMANPATARNPHPLGTARTIVTAVAVVMLRQEPHASPNAGSVAVIDSSQRHLGDGSLLEWAKDAVTCCYAQMYSSAMAPSRHLATVTMRAPFSNSPMTHVHSPEPNLIGCDVI